MTLQWSPVDGAILYLVKWQEVGVFGSHWTWTPGTQASIGGLLKTGKTYEWWITALNDYAYGSASEKRQFTTSAASSPSPFEAQSGIVARDEGHVVIVEK